MEQETTTKSIAWNSDTTYALGLYRLLTRILGIWPPKCQDVFAKTRSYTLVFLQVTMMMSLIAETTTECSTMYGVVELISLISCSIISILKVVVLRIFNSKMLMIIAWAVEDWSNVKTPSARVIMKKYAKLGRSVFIIQMASAYATTIPMIIGALPFFAPKINATDTNVSEIAAVRGGLPLATSCTFGDVTDIFYAIIFIVQALQLLSTAAGNVGNDVYFFGITMHLCGQFQILGEDLENFSIEVDKKKERDKLIEIIERHVRLSQLAQYLEDSFNIIILVQFFANTLQICLMGIQMILSLKSGNTVAIVNTIIILFVFGLQLFLYCYAGDRLSSQIANLSASAYFLPWYEMPSRQARDVLFIIMRNHKSFNVTAGKVYSIDIDYFKNLVKTLGSYFSVLRIMFDT